MAQEISASEMYTKSIQRKLQLSEEKKTKIMETILTTATKYGHTQCEIDPSLIQESAIISWLTETLHYTVNGNIISWGQE